MAAWRPHAERRRCAAAEVLRQRASSREKKLFLLSTPSAEAAVRTGLLGRGARRHDELVQRDAAQVGNQLVVLGGCWAPRAAAVRRQWDGGAALQPVQQAAGNNDDAE